VGAPERTGERAPRGGGAGAALREFLVHLRLPFQLALSVVPLWGLVWAEGVPTPRFLAVWLAWTVALSGGATAYNSYFDRDEGPVGGLRRPPRVRPSLLWLSLALQLAGAALLWLATEPVDLAVYAAGAMVFLAYSTPGVRTKRRPWRATATVAVGSGALASLAGSLTTGAASQAMAGTVAGMLSSSLFIAGFYPLTQVGQIDEDRRRGDRTFAVALGRDAAFAWAASLLPLAAAMSGWRAGWPAGAFLAAGLVPIGATVLLWHRRPRLDASPIADVVAYAAATVFALVSAAVLGL
jgi:4-hydroxybenzoate polyprenyltransferase